jgi:hypothetical protein
VTKLLPTQTKIASNLSADVPRSTDNVTAALRYKAHISCTGYGDVTGKTVNAIVGQKISLTCSLQSVDGSPAPAITNFSWTVPGITFSDYVATADSAVLYTNFPTTNSLVEFYWVDGGSKQVSCDVVVNGQTNTAPTTISVIRPEVSWTLTPKGSVGVDTNYELGVYFPGYYSLHVGLNQPTNNVGMMFSFQVANLKGFTNDYNILFYQIANFDWKRNVDSLGGFYLYERGYDVTFPIDWSQYYKTNGYRTDSPYSVLIASDSFYWRTDTFEDYLMFQPAGGKPVPLKQATWNWSGRAERVNTNSPPVFQGVAPFTEPTAATGVDYYQHPIWTNNVENIKENWKYHGSNYPTP